jgi:hypothetical protein
VHAAKLDTMEEQLVTFKTHVLHTEAVITQVATEDPLGALLPRVMLDMHAMVQE